ncbi:nucleotidyltransferase domain-containing protein [Candidatus Thorarchaeota archaeon]|nr:nucleotidyltransferase domain-containing protein [Candidatus Thorarchaeota archaeon]TFG95520.1 MAG: nucleotidyltransferase domain-containing protein [Candidatus Thorarchaeota archaeon]
MTDIHRRFDTALNDTVTEWKKNEHVKGIFVYGSYVRGKITAKSDLDIGIIWDSDDAPVQLMSTHKEVVIDMVFMTISEVEAVLDRTSKDVFNISEVVNRFRTSKVYYDPDKLLQKWQNSVKQYVWSDEVISNMKKLALEEFSRGEKFVEEEDYESAIYEVRDGLLHLGRVIVMTNNIFTMLKPAEVLTEIRMLDPVTYKLFLRTFKLRGMDEHKLLKILEEIKEWLDKTEKQLEEVTSDNQLLEATRLLAQAQREHYGSQGLSYSGDYEHAVLEMHQATCSLGRAMVALRGELTEDVAFIPNLRKNEYDFFTQILVEHGAYDIQPAEISRIISEAKFLAHRI